MPVDRGADLAAELQPLFDQLAVTQQECAEMRRRGRDDAELVRARATERARGIVAAAAAASKAERAAAGGRLRDRAAADSAALLAAAERDAATVRERAAERLPGHVHRVVASVRGLLGGDAPGAGAE